jgi:tetratricopeptide (TPR) repeat protein/DNA-binding SARP family transcriptional activator
VEFRVLGPVELRLAEDRRADLGSPKEQCALAVLLLSAGRTVSAATLGERIWGDDPPKKAHDTLQAYVSRLRKHLREANPDGLVQIITTARGYQLNIETSCLDLQRFESLVQRSDAISESNPEHAVELLRDALALFRGEPLAGIPGEWAEAARASLAERRRATQLKRIRIEVRLGHHHEVIGELTELTGPGSVDQGAIGLLMTALYRAGRPAEALAVYQRTRDRLVARFGLDPNRELQELQRRILSGDPSLMPGPPRQVAAPPPAVNALERDPQHFTGREADLSFLLEAVRADLREGFTSLCVVDGMAGVGKTTLCMHAAHQLRQLCPGGAIQLNLRGHNQHQPPMEPGEALIAMLRLLGADAAQLQRLDSLDTCISLWRDLTAEQPVLLLLDDARDADQISPLLPAARGSIVLVTSRSRLPELAEARARTLDVMPPADAAALFSKLAGPDRVDEPQRMREVTWLCGDLPLTVALAAHNLRARPTWRLADLAGRLSRARARHQDDPMTRRTYAAFDLSYQTLSDPQQELFRRLGLHPGTEISLHAAAALGGVSVEDADLMLDVLVNRHMLDEPVRHHYRLHDLLRDYAAQRAEADEEESTRENAVRRLLDFYVTTAVSAAHTLRPDDRRLNAPGYRLTHESPPVGSISEAQDWFEDEYPSLTSIARFALDRRSYRYAALLPSALAHHLERRHRWREAVDVLENALQAWYALGDRSGQAGTLAGLASAHWGIGNLESALFFAETALSMYLEQTDSDGQAAAHLHLGRIHWRLRNPAQADRHVRECVALRTGLGDRRGLAVAVYHLGILALDFGVPADGVGHFEKALGLARDVGDQVTERNCLNNLGVCYERTGDYPEALRWYQEALVLTRRIGSPHHLAMIAYNMGEIHSLVGDHESALRSFEDALVTFREAGDARSEVETLIGMSEAHLGLRQDGAALDLLDRCLALADHINDPLLHAAVQQALGGVYQQRSEYQEALKAYRSALLHARRAAAPADQARAYRRIGDVLAVTRGRAAARQQWRKALVLFEELKLPEGRELRELLGEAADTDSAARETG